MNELKQTIKTYDGDVDRYVSKLEFSLPKKELDNFMALLNGPRVLDAGCGAGRDSKYFAEKGFQVIGIDLSSNMLKAAKQRSKAKFLIKDIRKIGFKDSAFEGIWCYNSLLHLNDRGLDSALKEFNRVLAPKGILFIATKIGDGKIAKDSEKGTKYFFLYDEKHLIKLLIRSGFKIISTNKYFQRDEPFIDILAKKE